MTRLLLPLLIAACLACRGQDRWELANRSGKPWTLAQVEGARPARGGLRLLDKFTGRSAGTLSRAGDTVTVPAGARLMLVFERQEGDLFRALLLKDARGWYVEYQASVAFLSSPDISLCRTGSRLGPPMDREDDLAAGQFLDQAIEVGRDGILIHPDTLASAAEGRP